MDNENVFEHIKSLFGNLSDNFNILEEQIDIETQMQYFDYSRKYKKKINEEELLQKKETLFNLDTPEEEKKILIIQISSIGTVDAYRIIEKFSNEGTENLRNWAKLALQESRMTLESSFLNQNQIFISTGLGGKGTNLRYFIVLTSKNKEQFNETQKKCINNETRFAIENIKGELEDSYIEDFVATITCLIPITVSIKRTFKNIISECNQFGDFLSEHFIVTNVKKLSITEIKDFLEEDQKQRDKKELETESDLQDNFDEEL